MFVFCLTHAIQFQPLHFFFSPCLHAPGLNLFAFSVLSLISHEEYGPLVHWFSLHVPIVLIADPAVVKVRFL